jgi:signal transduction histidine kinase
MVDEIEQLKIENEHLRKQNAVKSDLISISAHQLRTSLSALKWILKMFIDKDLGKINIDQESFILKALESNDRMISLVNKLLVLNHTEDEDLKFSFEKTNILEVLEQTSFEFSGETHKKGVEFIFLRPEGEIPSINCDKEMIRVAFQNLIENAIKYSNENGKIFLSIKHNSETKEIEISVRDTGIGISKEDQEKIFGKFFRGANAIVREGSGSGLGLFTTRNIIEHHKGKIWFESIPGSGTTFFITLPILEDMI